MPYGDPGSPDPPHFKHCDIPYITWYYMILRGITVCIVYGTCFKTPRYFTIGYLFQNTMVFYHRLPVSKHHGILP